MSSLLRDLRFGVRMLAKSPGASVVCIVALAVGIAVCATVYSIVYGTLWRGLPFEGSDRIMVVHETNISLGLVRMGTPVHDYLDWREQQSTFESLEAFALVTINVSGTDRPERYGGALVTPGAFDALGARPLLGRLFREADGNPSAEPVVILGHSVWRDRFAADPEIAGRIVRVNGLATAVVGVMPEGFRFPAFEDAWLPLRLDPVLSQRGEGPRMTVFGRVREGVAPERAEVEITAIAAGLAAAHPESNAGVGARVRPFALQYLGGDESVVMMWATLGSVFFVLLIACANVANLLLAQAFGRAGEVAVRTALGASRMRVVRQLLVEVGVLALAGGIVGAILAKVGIVLFHGAVASTPPPFFMVIAIDTPVFLFVLAVVVLSTVLAGTIPALHATRTNLSEVLNDASRGASSLRFGRVGQALVVAQIALSCALLAGAGLMVRSVVNLGSAEYGFVPEEIFTARVTLFKSDYPEVESRRQFFSELRERLALQPSVEAVGLARSLPATFSPFVRFAVEGESYPTRADLPGARSTWISDGFFSSFEIELLDGREFAPSDGAEAPAVAIVNRTLADRFFPGEDALGRRVRIGTGDGDEGAGQDWRTIVGVVPDLRMGGPAEDDPVGIYVPMAQHDTISAAIAVRTGADPETVVSMLRREVRALDPYLPISQPRTMEGVIYDGTWYFWVFGGLFVVFGVVALFLASVGLYGVMSFAVQRKTREMGIRIALGARPGDVLRLVVLRGVAQIAAGLIAGLVLAGLVARFLAGMLFETEAADPLLYTTIVVALALTGLVACVVPAWRAARTDPLDALRTRG